MSDMAEFDDLRLELQKLKKKKQSTDLLGKVMLLHNTQDRLQTHEPQTDRHPIGKYSNQEKSLHGEQIGVYNGAVYEV